MKCDRLNQLILSLSLLTLALAPQAGVALDLLPYVCSGYLLPETAAPVSPSSDRFQFILDQFMRRLREGVVPSHAETEKTAHELMESARQFLDDSGIEYKLSADRKRVIIQPRLDRLNPPHLTAEANRLLRHLPRNRLAYLVYSPELLLTDISRIEYPMMFHELPYFFLSHLDLLRGPQSEFFYRQLEVASQQHRYGKFHSNPALTLPSQHRLKSLLEENFSPWTRTSSWPTARKRSIARQVLDEARKVLDEAGISYRLTRNGSALLFEPFQKPLSSHLFMNRLREHTSFMKEEQKYIYDPLHLIELDLHTSYEENLIPGRLMRNRQEGIEYFSHQEILHLAPEMGGVQRSPEEKQLDLVDEWIAKYLSRREKPRYLQSDSEPILLQGSPGYFGRYIGRYVDSAGQSVVTESWSDPFLQGIQVIHQPRGADLDLVFDRYLEDSRFWIKTRIGTAIQIGADRAFYDLNVGKIGATTQLKDILLQTPKRYAGALEAYLDYLKPVYLESLKMSSDQYERLRQISLDMRSRSSLLMLARDQLVEWAPVPGARYPFENIQIRLPPDIRQSDLPQGYAEVRFSPNPLSDEWEINSGLILVTSRSEAERLPTEELEDVVLPRPRDSEGRALPTGEASRMSNADPEMSLAYVKAAALKLKVEGMKGLYIKVDVLRKRRFERFAFKEAHLHPDLKEQLAPLTTPKKAGVGASYYPSGTEYTLYADIDEFLKSTLGISD